MTNNTQGAGSGQEAGTAVEPGPFPHGLAVAGAILMAVLLIAGALFGTMKLSEIGIAGVSQTLRSVCIAAWTVLIPAWFTLEEMLWAPPADDAEAVARFRKGQQAGHYTITLVGAIIFVIVLGASANASTAPQKELSAPAQTTVPMTAR